MSAFKSLRRGWRRFLAFWLAHIWLAVATLVIGVAGGALVLNLVPRRPDPEGGTTIYGWGMALFLLMVFLVVVAIASFVKKYSRESRLERIARLSTALQEAERIIAEINRDMEEGAERLAQLEARTAMHEELADLSNEKAVAIRGVIAEELGLERRSSIWRDLVFALLGAGLTFLLERFV